MSAIETLGLGAGSYLEPDSEYKTYEVTFTALCKCRSYICAQNLEEAKKIAEEDYTGELKNYIYDINDYDYIEGLEILKLEEK